MPSFGSAIIQTLARASFLPASQASTGVHELAALVYLGIRTQVPDVAELVSSKIVERGLADLTSVNVLVQRTRTVRTPFTTLVTSVTVTRNWWCSFASRG